MLDKMGVDQGFDQKINQLNYNLIKNHFVYEMNEWMNGVGGCDVPQNIKNHVMAHSSSFFHPKNSGHT